MKYGFDWPSEKMFDAFSINEFDSWDKAIFDPRALIWSILVEIYKIKLYTKNQRPQPSSFRKEDF